jgi:hypothetical protein
MMDTFAAPHATMTHIVESHLVLPSQFYPGPYRAEHYRDLLRAMLDDARHTVLAVRDHPVSVRLRRLAFEDSQWFLSDSIAPFSFLWTAEYLDLDAAAIRATLAPSFVHEASAPLPHVRAMRKQYAGYGQYHVAVVSRSRGYWIVQVGTRRTHIDANSVHPDSQVQKAGDEGTLLCTYIAARKAGLTKLNHHANGKRRLIR